VQLVKVLRSVALTLLLFLLVYIPAFAISGGMHLKLDAMVPVVMIVTLLLVCVYMAIAVHRGWLSTADFGWRWSAPRYVVYAVLFGAPLSALAAFIGTRFNESGTVGELHLTLWQLYLCFALGAPLQEESIFRGLLQSALAKMLIRTPMREATAGICASLGIGALFGVIHLKVGPVTAAAALVLGVLAGELRRRSGSLFPGILCHALFNLGGLVLMSQG
jgi:membrane protease YdiL (CAAX protease family)